MANILVLLESPSKVDKIQHFLSETFPENNYTVLASGGHINKIIDSGKYGLGIDIQTMTPRFAPEPSKHQNVLAIIKAGNEADEIILSSDPDREGEAIAWHLSNLFLNKKVKIKRATFNEITKDAVTKAMMELRDIDMALVNAQLSRQMLDKIIGYLVSKSLQKNTGLLSAGRVQTPALSILVNRDKIVKAFVSTEYKKISIINKKQNLNLALTKDNEGVTVNTDKTYYISEEKSQEIAKALLEQLKCTNYASKPFETRSFIPYSTAGLLQDGFSKLRLSTAQVSIAAQKLYEEGFVTYIRTDSTKYSNDFTKDAKAYINKNFEGNLFKDVVEVKKAMNAQEAHESIRPVDLHNTPEVVSNQITDATQKRLYNLIWWNTVKSLMRGPSGLNHRWTFDNNGYEFKQSWQEVTDYGYQSINKVATDENTEMNEDFEKVNQKDHQPKPNFEFNSDFVVSFDKEKDIKNEDAKTSPPNMYNQASLVKELKNLGIGRPSTYTPIITKLKEREYTVYKSNKPIEVTQKGYQAEEFLYKHFSTFFNLAYTAEMEEVLDKIANGAVDYVPWLQDIFKHIEELVLKEKQDDDEDNLICPRCKEGKLVFIKAKGNRGRGCSNFTKTGCGYREYEQKDGTWLEYIPLTDEEKKARQEAYIQENITDILCPKCKEANLMAIPARTNRGRGCSNYTKTGCGYREYEQKDGTWLEYVPSEKKKFTKKKK